LEHLDQLVQQDFLVVAVVEQNTHKLEVMVLVELAAAEAAELVLELLTQVAVAEETSVLVDLEDLVL
jgi:hypothetical protein